jgi:3-methyladenine DNA glycosylase/8-oxoguanine DNA glycosylase
VRAILGQQVSVRGATTLAGRLVDAFGERVTAADPTGPTHLFPTPERLARANVAKIGMPGTRANAIGELARRMADGRLSLSWGTPAEEAQDALCAIDGIGPWTAQYVAMRALGDPDTFLPGDLGVRRALTNGSGRMPTIRETDARSNAWRPWRSYAVLHLWMEDSDA